jgi:PleD family two-component response regulator
MDLWELPWSGLNMRVFLWLGKHLKVFYAFNDINSLTITHIHRRYQKIKTFPTRCKVFVRFVRKLLSDNYLSNLGEKTLTFNNLPIKILILNTDQDQHDTIKSVLEPEKFSIRRGGFHTQDIKNLQTYDPDVIIININILKTDGIAIVQQIRKFSMMPIIVITNMNKPGMVEKTLDAGADEYLIKPVPDNLMLAYINTLARRAKAEKNARKLLFGEAHLRGTRPQCA